LGYHVALQRRILRLALEEAGCEGDGLGFDVVDRILRIAREDRGALRVRPGVRVTRVSDALILSRPTPPFEIPVRIPGRTPIPSLGMVLQARLHPASEVRGRVRAAGPMEAFLDARAVGPGTAVRNPRAGDRLRPLGMTGTKSVGNLLADEKVPHPLRDGVPVLADGVSVLWVAGHRIAHAVRVTPSTKQVVHLRLRTTRSAHPGA
jgi:tRNA(Ile)-lysidine synthase